MSDGHKKPEFQPPKLGDEMERHGLVYDTSAASEVLPRSNRQKRSRNRNKNNRRDHNRPLKETRMSNEGQTAMNGTEGTREPRNNGIPTDGIFALTEVMQEHLKEQRGERGELRAHFKQIGDTLVGYNKHAEKLNEGMIEAAAAAKNTEIAVKELPEKMNEVKNLDNIKGDVRSAVVQVVVSAVVGGIIFLGMSLFGSKPAAPELEGNPPQPTPARKAA